MKKTGQNVLLTALLISVTIHVFAYCSVTAYIGWRKNRFYQGEKGSSVPLMEIGLISVAESSAPVQPESPRQEEQAGVPVVNASSDIMLAALPREVLPETDTSPDDQTRHPAAEKDAQAAPEGRAGVSPVSGGPPVDRYLQEVHRRIVAALYYPRRAKLSRLEGVVKVSFSIDKAGALLNPRVIESSPHMIFNRTALSILEKAAPFPEAGPEIVGKELAVSIAFESTY